MQVQLYHPSHDFQPADLPPMPGVQGPKAILKCARSGVIGWLAKDGNTVNIIGNSVRLNNVCTDDTPQALWYAKVTCRALADRGHHFAHLVIGSTHRIIPPPDGNDSRVEGVWVDGPYDPVKLLAGEFLPVKIRIRTRKARIAGTA